MQYNMTDKEFLDILNVIVKKESVSKGTINSLEDDLATLGILDSLGMVLLFVWITELFDIEEEVYKEFIKEKKFTGYEIRDFVKDNQKRIFTYEEFKEVYSKCI